MKACITAKTELLATHRWPGAPCPRTYLSNLHAHIFMIEVKAPVRHEDRDLEFHDLRCELEEVISHMVSYKIDGPPTFGDKSCEQIGSERLKHMPSVSLISVSEDGQFSAEVFREAKPPPGKRVYLASSSRGNRELLKDFADTIVRRGYFVFSPCLGFIGQETLEVRPLLLKIGLDILSQWANVLIFFNEGILSEGSRDEIEAANLVGIPVIIAKDSSGLKDLEETINAL